MRYPKVRSRELRLRINMFEIDAMLNRSGSEPTSKKILDGLFQDDWACVAMCNGYPIFIKEGIFALLEELVVGCYECDFLLMPFPILQSC